MGWLKGAKWVDKKAKAALGIVLLLMACGGCATDTVVPTAPPPIVAPNPLASTSLVDTICAEPAYASCAIGLDAFLDAMDSGALLAVCDFGDGTGDVVLIESGDGADAETACSGDGLVSPSQVVRVMQLP